MERRRFLPLTAAPLRAGASYRELLPDIPALLSCVRCFWGGDSAPSPGADAFTLVTPDACADIILRADSASGSARALFCGVDDTAFNAVPPAGGWTETFGIRFYFWALPLFCEAPLRGTLNCHADARAYFPALAGELLPLMARPLPLAARASAAQDILLRRLRVPRGSAGAFNAVHLLLRSGGRADAASLAGEACVSVRQLERLFSGLFGVPPKKLCRIVRYQCVWQDMVRAPAFDVQDAVARYGYTDQAHLLNEFRRFHTLPPREALRLARGTR